MSVRCYLYVSYWETNLCLDAQQLRLEQVQLGLDRREVGEVALQRLLHLIMLEQDSRGQRQSRNARVWCIMSVSCTCHANVIHAIHNTLSHTMTALSYLYKDGSLARAVRFIRAIVSSSSPIVRLYTSNVCVMLNIT